MDGVDVDVMEGVEGEGEERRTRSMWAVRIWGIVGPEDGEDVGMVDGPVREEREEEVGEGGAGSWVERDWRWDLE